MAIKIHFLLSFYKISNKNENHVSRQNWNVWLLLNFFDTLHGKVILVDFEEFYTFDKVVPKCLWIVYRLHTWFIKSSQTISYLFYSFSVWNECDMQSPLCFCYFYYFRSHFPLEFFWCVWDIVAITCSIFHHLDIKQMAMAPVLYTVGL